MIEILILNRTFCLHINNIQNDVNLLSPGIRDLNVRDTSGYTFWRGQGGVRVELLLQGTTL